MIIFIKCLYYCGIFEKWYFLATVFHRNDKTATLPAPAKQTQQTKLLPASRQNVNICKI